MSIKEKSSKKLDLSSAADFLIDQWLEEGFEEDPVDLKTFIESPDYLGLESLSPVQYQFVENMTDIYKGCLYTEGVAEWGKGSGDKDTKVFIVPNKLTPFTKDKEYNIIRVEDIDSDFTCYAWDSEINQIVEAQAKKPYIEGTGELYKVTLDNGLEITVTCDHRFYTPQGYKKLKELEIGEQILCGMPDMQEGVQAPSIAHSEKSQNIYTRISRKIWKRCGIFFSRLQKQDAFLGFYGRGRKNTKVRSKGSFQEPIVQSCKEAGNVRESSNSNQEALERNGWRGEDNQTKGTSYLLSLYQGARNKRVKICDSFGQIKNSLAQMREKISIHIQWQIEIVSPRFLFATVQSLCRDQRRIRQNSGSKSTSSTKTWRNDNNSLSQRYNLTGENSRINWRRIQDISYQGIDIFYDFEVPKYHNYIAVGNLNNGCIAPETLIETPAGPRMVADIEKDFKCFAYDGHGNIIKVKAHKPYIKGISDLFEVSTANGNSIIVTLDHQFITFFKGWQKLRDIQIGDEIFCAYDAEDMEWSPIIDIKFVRNGEYYDFFVSEYNNYLAQGFVNHNSNIEGLINHNSGKDHCCRIILARITYLLLNMKSPAEYYGLSKNSIIYTVNIGTSGEQAKDVFFDEYSTILENSPYFKRIGIKITGKEIQFPKNLRSLSCNSSVESWEGYNCIAVICDEIDAFKTEDELRGAPSARAKKSAHGTYYRALAATQSRFPNTGKVIELSWPRYKNSFIQQRRKIGRAEKGTYVACKDNGEPFATWDVHPSFDRSEFETLFAKNKKLAEAMYECKPGFSEDMFFQNDKPLLQSFEARYSEADIVIASPSPRNKNNWNDIISGKYILDGTGYFCIHIDLGYTHNKAAVGIAHKISEIRGDNNDYQSFIKVDALKCYYPEESTGEVNFQDIREDIFKIKQQGYSIWKATLDHYMSAEFKQNLNKSGINCDLVHFDRNSEIYDTFKDIVDAGRCQGFFDAELIYEFLRLQKIFNRKVVAAGDSPKDAADAIAGAVYQASQMPINRNQIIGNMGDVFGTQTSQDDPENKIQSLFSLPTEKGLCEKCVTKVGWWLPETPEEFITKQFETRAILQCLMCYEYFNDKLHKVAK